MLPLIFDGQFGLDTQDLDRIVVAEGPGSYTGLRIAVATAKIAGSYLNIELVGMSSQLSLLPPTRRFPCSLDGLRVVTMFMDL